MNETLPAGAPIADAAPLPAVAQGELQEVLMDAYGGGQASSYWSLNSITAAYGIQLGRVAGAEGMATEALIPPLVDRIWKKGSAFRRQLCQAFYQSLPWCRPMRDWIARYQPDDLHLVNEEVARDAEADRARVATVATAFDDLRRSNDPALERQIAKARDDLQAVSDKLLTLRASKSIHDALHGVQTTTYPELVQLVGGPDPLSDTEADIVESQRSKLEDAMLGMDGDLITLAGGEMGDAAWLADLKDSCAPLADRPPTRVRIGTSLYGLRAVLRQQLPRFDAATVSTAKSIPFGAAIDFLRDASAKSNVLASARSALEDAAAKLTALDADLNATIRLHEAWQQVDAPFWLIEQELQPAEAAGKHERVQLQWRAATRRLDMVRSCSPTMWDPAVEAGMVRVDEVLGDGPELTDVAASALARFIRLSRLVFLRVDKTVLARCTQIGRLRDPIEALLREGDRDVDQ